MRRELDTVHDRHADRDELHAHGAERLVLAEHPTLADYNALLEAVTLVRNIHMLLRDRPARVDEDADHMVFAEPLPAEVQPLGQRHALPPPRPILEKRAVEAPKRELGLARYALAHHGAEILELALAFAVLCNLIGPQQGELGKDGNGPACPRMAYRLRTDVRESGMVHAIHLSQHAGRIPRERHPGLGEKAHRFGPTGDNDQLESVNFLGHEVDRAFPDLSAREPPNQIRPVLKGRTSMGAGRRKH